MKRFSILLFVVFVIVVAFWSASAVNDSLALQDTIMQFGYGGLFFAAILSGFNLLVPIPVVSFIPLLVGAGLHLWVSVFVIAIGMTLGDLIGYTIGRAGRSVVPNHNNRVVQRLEKLREKYPVLPMIILFLYVSFAPAPNEVLVIPMGFLRYRVIHIFGTVLLGNIIFNSLSALAFFGIFEVLLR